MIQIFVHLAFYYIEHELFTSKALVVESDLHLFICPQKYNNGTMFFTGEFQ